MKISVTGPLEIDGFPADQPFVFESHGDTVILRAGTKPFLVVRRERVETVVSGNNGLQGLRVRGLAVVDEVTEFKTSREPEKTDLQRMHEVINAPRPPPVSLGEGARTTLDIQRQVADAEKSQAQQTAQAQLNGAHIIQLDVSRANKYRTNRRKWFDVLTALNGRPLNELPAAAKTHLLEGDWSKLVQFFIDEGALRLVPADVQPTAAPVHPLAALATQAAPVTQTPTTPQGGPGAFMSGANAQSMFGGSAGPAAPGESPGLLGASRTPDPHMQQAQQQTVPPEQRAAATPGPLWSPPWTADAQKTTNGPKFP